MSPYTCYKTFILVDVYVFFFSLWTIGIHESHSFWAEASLRQKI